MLVKAKMSARTIRNAFVAVEDSKLSIDLLKSLKQNAPTMDEVSVALTPRMNYVPFGSHVLKALADSGDKFIQRGAGDAFEK